MSYTFVQYLAIIFALVCVLYGFYSHTYALFIPAVLLIIVAFPQVVSQKSSVPSSPPPSYEYIKSRVSQM